VFAALFVVAPIEAYKEALEVDSCVYRDNLNNMEKTPEQMQNWVSQKDIMVKLAAVRSSVTHAMKAMKAMSPDWEKPQQFVLLALTSGQFIPPRRALDWSEMRFKDLNDVDKYYIMDLTHKKFIFRVYKTVKSYGEQTVAIPSELVKMLKQWRQYLCRVLPLNAYVLVDSKGDKLNSVKISQRLNRVFDGKKVSINMLRHSYLSDQYVGKSLDLEKAQKNATAMGNSPMMSLLYAKK